jgi:predicted enzyme related to lactoylglutathione lyase
MSKLSSVRSVLAVKNLPNSISYYSKILDFAIDFESEDWCFLSRDAVKLMLGHCPDAIPASEINDHSYIAYIEVQEIDELHRELQARGLKLLATPESKPWGMREFMLTTPDGHRIMFAQDLQMSDDMA